jgi:hypothetical protein
MAVCQPQEAIWVVMTQADGHRVLLALSQPLDGIPHVQKTYAPTMHPSNSPSTRLD